MIPIFTITNIHWEINVFCAFDEYKKIIKSILCIHLKMTGRIDLDINNLDHMSLVKRKCFIYTADKKQ